MILANIFFTVVFGALSLYTFYLAIKIMLMSEEEYKLRYNEIVNSWITYDNGIMVKKNGVGIKRKLKRKLKPKEKSLKNNELDF